MTKVKEYRRKMRQAKAKIKAIQKKYPQIDILDPYLREDIKKVDKLLIEFIYLKTNADYCADPNPDKRCETCNCWKQTRVMSS